MSLDHWLMLLRTPRWLIPCVSSSPKPKGPPQDCAGSSSPYAAGMLCRTQEPLIAVRKQLPQSQTSQFQPAQDVMTLGQMANCTTWWLFQVYNYLGRDLILLPVPCPKKTFLSLFCSAWHLKACILYFLCRPCAKGAINSWFSIQEKLLFR